MTALRPLAWRLAAERDAVALALYYAVRGGVSLEVGFLGELEAMLGLTAVHPGSGSTRHACLFPELPIPL